jgi:methyl-accepting chemotaxis protein
MDVRGCWPARWPARCSASRARSWAGRCWARGCAADLCGAAGFAIALLPAVPPARCAGRDGAVVMPPIVVEARPEAAPQAAVHEVAGELHRYREVADIMRRQVDGAIDETSAPRSRSSTT